MQPFPPNQFSSEAVVGPSTPVVVPVVHPAPTSDSASPTTAPSINRDQVVVWDVPFDVVSLTQSIQRIGELIERRQPSYAITANLNYVMLHANDPSMRPITEQADLIVADGQPIVWRSRLAETQLPERVAGSEMIYDLAEAASQKGWKIYFLGGEEGVAAECAKRLVAKYPGLQIAGVESPPFRNLNDQEQAAQDARIQESGADILLVAFGQPKGERWIYDNYQRLGVPVSIQLGASFDFVAGTAIRAPKMWQKIGMEWFYRMVNDPGRMIPRYASNAWFLVKALCKDWHSQVKRWGMDVA
ncbi:WecB/TagA/CpsF family glycosyltransferase [Planctomycetes bacterium K23_9]|uniref:N-acetylmannosaminyltransferase n=1 Tax=Stieleria marina TaxID=1930275 RepID=A0A517P2I2_9BACT|nr:Putative N-acetylmannosaminyltransferase [Planctomycetes bacterium K23_9]